MSVPKLEAPVLPEREAQMLNAALRHLKAPRITSGVAALISWKPGKSLLLVRASLSEVPH